MDDYIKHRNHRHVPTYFRFRIKLEHSSQAVPSQLPPMFIQVATIRGQNISAFEPGIPSWLGTERVAGKCACPSRQKVRLGKWWISPISWFLVSLYRLCFVYTSRNSSGNFFHDCFTVSRGIPLAVRPSQNAWSIYRHYCTRNQIYTICAASFVTAHPMDSHFELK